MGGIVGGAWATGKEQRRNERDEWRSVGSVALRAQGRISTTLRLFSPQSFPTLARKRKKNFLQLCCCRTCAPPHQVHPAGKRTNPLFRSLSFDIVAAQQTGFLVVTSNQRLHCALRVCASPKNKKFPTKNLTL